MYTESDRTTNIEVLKANKNANKAEIMRLRDENKECRQKLAVLLRVCYSIYTLQLPLFLLISLALDFYDRWG